MTQEIQPRMIPVIGVPQETKPFDMNQMPCRKEIMAKLRQQLSRPAIDPAGPAMLITLAELKLTKRERNEYDRFLREFCSTEEFKAKIPGQQKKDRSRIKMYWLSNRKQMMKNVPRNKTKKEIEAEKLANGNSENPEDQTRQQQRPKFQKKYISLMDIDTSAPVLNLCQPQEYPTTNSAGYQYLTENWMNTNTNSSSSSTWQPDASNGYTSSSYSMFPTSSSNSIPTTSSSIPYLMPNTYAATTAASTDLYSNSSAAPNCATSFAPQPQTNQGYDPMMPDLISQALMGNSYPSQYYQEPSPQVTEILAPPKPPSAYQLAFGSSSAPTPPIEVVEDDHARQRRLDEIEAELTMINARKDQMAMEAEIRRREEELALQQQLVELKERELRDKDRELGRMTSDRSYTGQSSSRHHDRDRDRDRDRCRDRDRDRDRNRKRSRDRRDHREDHYRDRHDRHSQERRTSSSSASSSRAISNEERDRLRAERDSDARRRHGQRSDERKRFLPRRGRDEEGNGEGSSKRFADHSKRSTREAEPPRDRHFHLQEISDDE